MGSFPTLRDAFFSAPGCLTNLLATDTKWRGQIWWFSGLQNKVRKKAKFTATKKTKPHHVDLVHLSKFPTFNWKVPFSKRNFSCMFSTATSRCLHELSLPFRGHLISLLKGSNEKRPFLKRNMLTHLTLFCSQKIPESLISPYFYQQLK